MSTLVAYQKRLPETVGKGQLYGGYRTGSVVMSRDNRQLSRRMLDIAGVMEVVRWGDEERFEAAVQTDEGPKTFSGSLPNLDVQSGSLYRWQVILREADRAIRRAYDSLLPKEAIKVISTIWEQLDRTSELAAARSRLLVGKLGKPKLAVLPEWFEDQKVKLLEVDEGELAANPCAIASAEFLVRAALAAISRGAELEAEIEAGPRGRVVIDWHIPNGRLQWMVEAVDIPWPSVKVYQVAHKAAFDPRKALESRIFYNAFDVVDSFVQFLGSN